VGVEREPKKGGGNELHIKRQKVYEPESESSEASVELGQRKLAPPHRRARASAGPTMAPVLLPRLLALVGVRKEGQSGFAARAIDDGYGRMARRREAHRIWRYGVDVRFVRLGRGQIRDERRHLVLLLLLLLLMLLLMLPASRWVRRQGIAKSVRMERGALG
jgi:hypothetical protein